MAILTVQITVNGVPQLVNFNTGLQAWVTTLPQRSDDLYDVVITAVDSVAQSTIVATFLTIPEGEIVQFYAQDRAAQPLEGVSIVAHHRNPTGGSNWGRADSSVTAKDGKCWLHLKAGSYNVEVSRPGYQKQVVQNFQVYGGIDVFDNTGGVVPESHVVKDAGGTPLPDISVKIVDVNQGPQSALVAHIKTDSDGVWSTAFKQATPYDITFERAGLDYQKVEVQSA